jgi:hypothetical protein
MGASRTNGFNREAITEKSKSNRGAARPAVKGSVMVGVMLASSEGGLLSKAIGLALLTVVFIVSQPFLFGKSDSWSQTVLCYEVRLVLCPTRQF